MATVVRRVAKLGCGFTGLALTLSKIVNPFMIQLQKLRTDELIGNERFEQALNEGEARFDEESEYILDIIRQYFEIEALAERLRTCQHQEKRYLWNEMKTLAFARLMSYIYLSCLILIISKAQMVIIAKYLTKKHSKSDDDIFDSCRSFMDETKGLYAVLIAEICPVMIQVSRNILEITTIDSKAEDGDVIKSMFMQLKSRADVSFSLPALIKKFYSSQLSPSNLLTELTVYCQTQKFSDIFDYLTCDVLDEVAKKGFDYIHELGKAKIILSWIIYLSSFFNADQSIPLKIDSMSKWKKGNMMFSHLAILFCEDTHI